MYRLHRATSIAIVAIVIAGAIVGCGRGHRSPLPTPKPFAEFAPTRPAASNAAVSDAATTTQSVSGNSERGRMLFHGEAMPDDKRFVPCTTCHYVQASKGVLVGPNMDGVADRAGTRIPGVAAADYIRRSITRHDEFIVEGFEPGVMLSIVGDDFGNILPPEEIDNLAAYLMTLKEGTTTEGETEAASQSPPLGQPVLVGSNGDITINNEFAFHPVEGWETRAITNTVTTYPADAISTTGPVIALRTDTIANLNIPNVKTSTITQTDAFLDMLLQHFQDETASIAVEDVQPIEIGGAPGRVASFSGRGFGDLDLEDVRGRLAVAKVDDIHTFVMIGIATPPEQWTATNTFDMILQSITFLGDIGGSTEGQSISDVRIQSHAYDLSPYTVVQARASLAQNENENEGEEERDRRKGPRFACINCHVSHDVTMAHASNASCISCHSGTSYQRHCVDCHSIHNVDIPHTPNNPSCESCHAQGIPSVGVNVQETLITFLSYLFKEI